MEETTQFQATVGRSSRLVVGRLRPGTDLISGIAALAKEHGLRCGAIVSCIGSLQRATFVTLEPSPDSRVGAAYGDPIEVEGPIEFLGGRGLVGQDNTGTVRVHFHGVVSDAALRVQGGHFDPGGNPVLATLEVVIAEIEGVELARQFDEEVGLVVTYPSQMADG